MKGCLTQNRKYIQGDIAWGSVLVGWRIYQSVVQQYNNANRRVTWSAQGWHLIGADLWQTLIYVDQQLWGCLKNRLKGDWWNFWGYLTLHRVNLSMKSRLRKWVVISFGVLNDIRQGCAVSLIVFLHQLSTKQEFDIIGETDQNVAEYIKTLSVLSMNMWKVFRIMMDSMPKARTIANQSCVHVVLHSHASCTWYHSLRNSRTSKRGLLYTTKCR